MGFLDYISGKEPEPGKSVLEENGNKQTYTYTDQGLVPVETSPLPEIGGLIGGIGGALLSKSPAGARVGQTAGQALVRSLVPSLVGSTAGTTIGLGAEGLLTGQMTPQRAFGALAENAAWDVGGNLVFSAGGKAYRVARDVLGFNPAATLNDPVLAAQKFLSDKGATLSKGQLTGSNLDLFLEEVSKGGTGASAYKEQQKKVGQAVSQGVEDVKNTLQTSPAFNAALNANEPLSRAAGENFQNLINTARTDFKDKYRPFYDSLSKDYGVYVDMRGLKSQAAAEMKQLERTKFAGAGAARKEVLDDILKQDDFIEFGAAHDLRSAFSGAANDLKIPGAGTTSKGAAYSKYASEVEKQMDSAMQITGPSKARAEKAGVDIAVSPATSTEAVTTGTTGFNPYTQRTTLSKEMVQKYAENQKAYKQGMEGLYNETINEGMKLSPSKVGEYIFDLSQTEKSTDLFKAITQVDKYAKQGTKEAASQVLGDFKYGFLNQAFSSPEKIKAFTNKITKGNAEYNPEMEAAFYKLFASEAKPLKEVLNAADIGLEDTKSGIAAFLRNKATITGGQAAAGVGGYLLLPESVRDKINLPETLLTAGVFALTPRLIAKAATNKEAVNALADYARVQGNPKFAGAAAVKMVDRLNSLGIIDNEYLNEVNTLFAPAAQQPTQQQTQPVAPTDNFLDYLNK